MTRVDVAVGEIAAAGATVATVATADVLEVTADVPETDALRLREDLVARLTLDALPGRPTLEGRVTAIAPAAIVLEGVPTYEVTMQLPPTDLHMKPGLTVDITVETATREHALAVPRRAILSKDGQQLVRVREADGAIREQAVSTGLLGSDGYIEITSGLAAGQTVAL